MIVNPAQPLQDRTYEEIVQLERNLADLESQSLHDAVLHNVAPSQAWTLWHTVCSAHDVLLAELDRRELYYEDA